MGCSEYLFGKSRVFKPLRRAIQSRTIPRHPGEEPAPYAIRGRGPGPPDAPVTPDWIPAFAGMTEGRKALHRSDLSVAPSVIPAELVPAEGGFCRFQPGLGMTERILSAPRFNEGWIPAFGDLCIKGRYPTPRTLTLPSPWGRGNRIALTPVSSTGRALRRASGASLGSTGMDSRLRGNDGGITQRSPFAGMTKSRQRFPEVGIQARSGLAGFCARHLTRRGRTPQGPPLSRRLTIRG